jgi:hypothetical protein
MATRSSVQMVVTIHFLDGLFATRLRGNLTKFDVQLAISQAGCLSEPIQPAAWP